MARIGIFGGSFDPPHLGHLLAVREFQTCLGLDRVIVIPAADPPHKSAEDMTPAEIRLRLARLTFETLPFAEVSDLELRREGPSYTVDTLRELKEQYPEDELFLLMGTDMFFAFQTWREPENIAALADIAVAHRDKDDRAKLEEQARCLREELKARVTLVENRFVPHSSTSVRALLAFGLGEGYVAEEVLQSIRAEGLYLTGKDLKQLPFDELRRISLQLHWKRRVPHVIGCSDTAVLLAEKYGEDPVIARRAGILHDITKALNGEEQLYVCDRFALELSEFERSHPKLLHAKTGAAVAQRVFGEAQEVVEAIYWHTTGRAAMTTMEKIIYLADYMEPNRDFPGVEELRTRTLTALDSGLEMGLQMSVDQLTQRRCEIDPNSMGALRYLQERKQIG